MKKTNKKDLPTKVKKVKKSKKVEALNEDGHSKYYKCIQKVVSKQSSTEHWIFLDVDDQHKVDNLTLKGTRLLIARYPDFYKIYLYKTHSSGEPSWPNGGVTVYNATYETMQCFYYDSVAIHPEGGSYKFQT